MRLVLFFKDLQQGVVHKQVIQMLELLQRVLVVLASTLREDVHLEVGLGNLRLVGLLVARRILLSLALEGLLHTHAHEHTRQLISTHNSWQARPPKIGDRFISSNYEEIEPIASRREKFKFL